MKLSTTDDIFDLMDANVSSAGLNTAMELGLFWILFEEPMDAVGVAEALNIPANRCNYWLQLLCNTGLLERYNEQFTPSSIAQTAILNAYSQDTWAFLAREARDRYPALHDLALHIHPDGSVWAAQGLKPPDYFAQISQIPEKARRFTRMLYEIHIPLADQMAESLDMSGAERLLDLGGGSGVVSLALLRRYPHLSSVVVDIPNVCAAGREIAFENAMEDRINYHAADFLHDELPSGFDVVLECDVGSYNDVFFRKLKASLNPGGRLVIVDQFASSEGVAPPSWKYWAFLVSLENPNFTLPTAAEVQNHLKQAGFHLLSESMLSPSEVLRWSSDWTMIETRI